MSSANPADPYGLTGSYTPYGKRPPSTDSYYGADADMDNDPTLCSGATTPTRGTFTPGTTVAGSIAGDWDDGPDTSLGPLHTCPSCKCRPLTVFGDADGPFDCEQLRGVISEAASKISNAELAISRKPKVVSARTEEEKEYIQDREEEIAEARTEMLTAYYQLTNDDVRYRKYIDVPMSAVTPWPNVEAQQNELVSLMTKGNGLPADLKSAYSVARGSSVKMPILNQRLRLASLRLNPSGSTSTSRR
jgi:hypothetical protein